MRMLQYIQAAKHSRGEVCPVPALMFQDICFGRDWVRTVKIPKRIAKRRAELESEGYQVLSC